MKPSSTVFLHPKLGGKGRISCAPRNGGRDLNLLMKLASFSAMDLVISDIVKLKGYL